MALLLIHHLHLLLRIKQPFSATITILKLTILKLTIWVAVESGCWKS